MRVLVLGATGNVGAALVDALRERGVEVRAVSRGKRSWPDGVEGVVGDPNEPHSLDDATDGIDGAFLMSGYAVEATLLDELDSAHVVLLSSSSADLGETGNAMGAYHLASEQAVKASGLAWTVLRPCSFQSNVLRWKDQLAAGDLVRAPFGDVPTAMVDPADIAAVAAAALVEPGHIGEAYRISGPEPLTPADQVAIVAEVLDRPLRFEGIDDEEARTQLTESMGADYAAASFDIFRDHPQYETPVQSTVRYILGRPPGSLSQWVRRHADEFATRP